ncbi:MAG: S8 family serine peptidase [Saprospiraceae bacterium]|nr:S8 family serine peptidase [Saprospiraceae bacterium]
MGKIDSMTPFTGFRAVFICLCYGLFLNANAQKLDYVQGEFIVQVSSDNDMMRLKNKLRSASARNFDFKSRQLMSEPLNIWLISVDFAQVDDIAFEKSLKSFSGLMDVRRNRIISPRREPNDAEFFKQWQYINTGSTGGIAGADMDMELAWDITTGGLTALGDTIVVCVIDEGFNSNHEDLKDNVWTNYHEIPGNGLDDDANGYVDDFKGWNVTSDDDVVTGNDTHGSSVAGIVGAKGNNGIGVSGVNWNVKVMLVVYGQATEANAISSYAYPYQMRKLYNQSNGSKGAFVVVTNASWGIDQASASSAPLWCALFDSLGQVGILNCGATSNLGIDVDIEGDLPTSCSSEFLIAVTNLNKSDLKVGQAAYGRKSVDLGSYGERTYTTAANGYRTFGGTSGATPHVSGMVGLLYAVPCAAFSNLAKDQPANAALIAKDMILHGVISNNSLQGITTSGGKLNAFRSISNMMKLCEPCSVPAGIRYEMDDLSMKIDWASNSGSSEIKVRYRKPDQQNWTTLTNVIKGQIITGLDYCSEYEVQIGSSCGLIPGDFSYSKYVITGGCCPKPEAIEWSSNGNAINVNWTSVENATYLIQYKPSSGMWQEVNLNTNAFNLSDLPGCSGYDFRVQAFCNKYSNTSDFTKEIAISTSCGKCTENEYCGFSTKDASQEWISMFRTGTLENQSGTSESGYRNFAGVATTDFLMDQKYDFEVAIQYAGTTFPDYVKILLDWNQDGFWNQDEQVFKTTTPVSEMVSGSFRIPDQAVEGYTRLRLILSYEDFESGCDTDIFDFGEVEDYCVNIIKNTCRNEAKVTPVFLDKNKIIFATEYLPDVKDSILISYREIGQADWIEVFSIDTITIAGLSECTMYEYTFRSQCGNIFSEVSAIDTFKTACKIGVHDQFFDALVVYPNPCYDLLTVKADKYSNHITSLRLIDQTGKTMTTQRYKSVDSQQHIIYMNSFPAGLYLLEVSTKTGIKYYKKVVKIAGAD